MLNNKQIYTQAMLTLGKIYCLMSSLRERFRSKQSSLFLDCFASLAMTRVPKIKTERVYFVFALMMIAGTAWASFDVMDQDTEGYYGRAENAPFKKAVEGTETLSEKDKAFLESVEETRVTERWYTRLLIGRPKVKVVNLSNKSTEPLSICDPGCVSYSGLQPAFPNAEDNLYQFLWAGGHVWENWALEMEAFFSKTLNYEANPVFNGYPRQLSASIKQYALFANVQYILPHWFDILPRRLQVHLDAGVGGAIKTADVNALDLTGNPQGSASSRAISAAAQLGVGVRYQLTMHILADISYRYINLGNAKLGPVAGFQMKSNQVRSTGVFIGLTYQI